jgi:hypothetical protein
MALSLAETGVMLGVTIQVYVTLLTHASVVRSLPTFSTHILMYVSTYALTRILRYRTPGDWIARAQSIRVLEPTACALGCAVDMIIAGVLILLLGKGKSHYQQ